MGDCLYKEQHKIIGRYIIHAEIKTLTPVLIGKGIGDVADIEIMRLPDGKPYIPASTFAGVLKQHFAEWYGETKMKTKEAKFFWGTGQKKINGKPDPDQYQCHFVIDDLLTTCDTKNKITRRDGIKIDYKTGITEKKAKYDYELLEPEITFNLRAEVTVRKVISNPKIFEEYISYISAILNDDSFRIGAQTNTGFGKIQCSGFNAWYFDFSDKKLNRSEEWFTYLKALEERCVWEKEYYDIRPGFESIKISEIKCPLKSFNIYAEFGIKNSIIIGAYGIDAKEPDKTHLKSNSKNVLTGKSVRGAIRHRALKILNTLPIDNAEEKIKELFGYVENQNQEKDEIRGKLRVEENYIAGKGMTQNRIKIDRFTGGTMSGALFNSKPLWKNKNGEEGKLILDFALSGKEFKETDALLLLHLLKDLWTADLPIGGEKSIGRGILTGRHATVNYGGKQLVIEAGENGIITFKKQDLLPTITEWEQTFINNLKTE
ncbi:MAG: RAMP superfamily CRISPR-associated protein [Chitinophagales bacterium]|nr:RAMP superfamily CRISPR-associated protein [Chitinophagales bacterium]